MAEFPAMPMWTDAYLGDTSHLTTTEHGAYLLLLFAMWRSGKCSLTNDDKLLARYARCTTGQWARMRSTIMAFFAAEDGKITQGRLTDEWHAVKRKSLRQSDKAKSRWLKTKETPNAVAMPDECRTDASLTLTLTTSVIEEAKAPSITARKRAAQVRADLNAEFDRVWAAYPKQLGEGAARKKWATARRTHTYEEIATPLRACVRAVKGTDPQFIPKLSTWLAEERWNDNPEHAANRSRTSTEDLRELARISSTDDLARLMAPQLRIAR